MTAVAAAPPSATTPLDAFSYDDAIVRKFLVACVAWGAIGMLVGVLIALQLADPMFNFGLPFTSFGRLRPLHTNAVIFAFARQRLLLRLLLLHAAPAQGADVQRCAEQNPLLGLAGASSSPPRSRCRFGFTQAKEYAELEWPIDIAIAVVWVVFAVNFFGTLVKRRERHLYVALWFYIAIDRHRRDPAHLQQPVGPGRAVQELLASTPACRTRSCSGGTATTPSRSSSRRRSSA